MAGTCKWLENRCVFSCSKKNTKTPATRDVASFSMKPSHILGHLLIYSLNVHVVGKGGLEIKCPYSIANAIPSLQNLSFLTQSNGQVTLKQNYKYFAQVQGQMAITKRKWCQFLVYTKKGFISR